MSTIKKPAVVGISFADSEFKFFEMLENANASSISNKKMNKTNAHAMKIFSGVL